MTAEIIRIEHGLPEFLFHCPMTGTPIMGDIEQSFENFASPYYLFSITTEGVVYARRDELPEPVGSALKRVVDNLFDVGRPGPDGISPFELHVYMPNAIADMLPDSTVIFNICNSNQRNHQDSPTFWIVMDFTLPIKVVSEECVDNVADLVRIE